MAGKRRPCGRPVKCNFTPNPALAGATIGNMIDWSSYAAVERDRERLSGAWVFRGSRVPVAALFESLEDGVPVGQFAELFPSVTLAQARAVLDHAGIRRVTASPKEALNKSILDFSASVIGKAWFSDDSQNQWLTAADFGSASLRCGNRQINQRFPNPRRELNRRPRCPQFRNPWARLPELAKRRTSIGALFVSPSGAVDEEV
jgi:uncharacterized protein (DUF433 family)